MGRHQTAGKAGSTHQDQVEFAPITHWTNLPSGTGPVEAILAVIARETPYYPCLRAFPDAEDGCDLPRYAQEDGVDASRWPRSGVPAYE